MSFNLYGHPYGPCICQARLPTGLLRVHNSRKPVSENYACSNFSHGLHCTHAGSKCSKDRADRMTCRFSWFLALTQPVNSPGASFDLGMCCVHFLFYIVTWSSLVVYGPRKDQTLGPIRVLISDFQRKSCPLGFPFVLFYCMPSYCMRSFPIWCLGQNVEFNCQFLILAFSSTFHYNHLRHRSHLVPKVLPKVNRSSQFKFCFKAIWGCRDNFNIYIAIKKSLDPVIIVGFLRQRS